MNIFNIFQIWFLTDVSCTEWETHQVFLLLNANHNIKATSTIIERDRQDPSYRKAQSLSLCKNNILKLILPSLNSVYNCHNPKGLKFIARVSLSLYHSREHNPTGLKLITRLRLGRSHLGETFKTFRIGLVHYVTVASIENQPSTSFCHFVSQ